MNTIIFLGGVPGTGKTTLAYKLAEYYGIDKVISLDVLKSVLKQYIQLEEKYIYTTTHEAYKIENLSVVDGFIKHSRIINEYFVNLIKPFTKEKVIVVEGATITNEMLEYFKDSNLIYINFYVDDIEIISKRYKSKARMRKGKWLDNIDNILKINEYLQSQSLYNIKIDDLNKTFKEVGKYIDESIFL